MRVLQPGGQAHLALEALDADRGGQVSGGRTLTTTFRPTCTSSARKTRLIPPPAELAQDPVAGANRVLHLALEIGQAVHPGKRVRE